MLVVLNRSDVGLEVISDIAVIIVTRIAVDSEEEDVRILVLDDFDRRIELVARHDDDFCAILNQGVNRSDTGGGAIARRLLVFVFGASVGAEIQNTFPASLVEG